MGNYDHILGTGFDKVISNICIVRTCKKKLKKNCVNVIFKQNAGNVSSRRDNLYSDQVLTVREQNVKLYKILTRIFIFITFVSLLLLLSSKLFFKY